MTIMVMIPARQASTRYPGKPLALVKGATGILKSLIQRTWEAATKVDPSFPVFVATDASDIAEHVTSFGGTAVMTSPTCRNGTERCWDAISQMEGHDDDIIVNFQGDSLLTPPIYARQIVDFLILNPEFDVATAAIPCEAEHYRKLEEDCRNDIIGGTFVVMDRNSRALYFSKRMIPYGAEFDTSEISSYLHIGIYAYRRRALKAYCALPISAYERREGLEQLRFLDNAIGVGVVKCQSPNWELWELNNPSDLGHIENALSTAALE
jgi:3-deoxy-manno-octulosonate cytidylyltransferase (CMP-KDO synthetase)